MVTPPILTPGWQNRRDGTGRNLIFISATATCLVFVCHREKKDTEWSLIGTARVILYQPLQILSASRPDVSWMLLVYRNSTWCRSCPLRPTNSLALRWRLPLSFLLCEYKICAFQATFLGYVGITALCGLQYYSVTRREDTRTGLIVLWMWRVCLE